MIFHTADMARVKHSADWLLNSYESVNGSQCFMVGAGPSLTTRYSVDDLKSVAAQPIPKVSMNYGGFSDEHGWLVRPDIWTTYDPTNRFSAELIWSPNVVKFFRTSRAMNLIPGSTHKVCEAPRTVFFDSCLKTYTTFFGHDAIVDSRDSYIQAVDIAIRLGFKHIYMLGVDLRVKPSERLLTELDIEGVSHEGERGVHVKNGILSDRLRDYILALSAKRKHSLAQTMSALDASLGIGGSTAGQYCFAEQKSLADAVTCDDHYWNTVQYMRQARSCLAKLGVIVYAEEGSRLAPFFPVVNPLEVQLGINISIPKDSTVGKYTADVPAIQIPHHADIPPFAGFAKDTKEAQAKKPKPQIVEEA